jgi:hypothetical protein
MERAINNFISLHMMGKINVFEDTPEDKEQYIVEMLQQGYSYKQIMTQWHVSPSSISAVKKKFFGSSDNENLIETSKTSKESQAFRLFQQGKSVVDAKIEFDIDSSDAALYYEKYQELSNFHNFNIAYKEVKGVIVPFFEFFNLTKSLGMTSEKVAEAVKCGNALPQLQTMHSNLSRDVHALEREKMNLDCQIQLMADQKDDYMRELEYNNYQCEMKKKELTSLDSEINLKKAFIQNLDNNEGYNRIKMAAAEQINSVLRDNRLMVPTTISATLESIRLYPENQALIIDLLTSQSSTGWFQQSWTSSHGPQLFHLTQQVQKEIAEQISRMAVTAVETSRPQIETSQL